MHNLVVRRIISVSIIVVFVSGAVVVNAIRSEAPVAQAEVSLQLTRKGSPLRLTIPKIHVDAAIRSVGLTPQGAMGAPEGPSDVAWFDQGPRPGETGTAVIDGHFGWKGGAPAVFDTLSTLQAGDTLSVENSEGVVTTFIVRELRRYGQHENTDAVFYSNDGNAHLNLITCEGLWDTVSKTYAKRLVVFTDKDTK